MTFRIVWLVLGTGVASFPGSRLAHAAKTDVVTLKNGDRITGEVKGLARGKLDYSTDDAGRLSIEWEKVARVSSVHPFQLEQQSGIKHFGTIGAPDRDGFVVVRNQRNDTLAIASVIEISPINASFPQRVTSYLDVGFTLAKAHRATTFSLSGAADYRGPSFGSQLKFDSYAQGQETVPTTTRNSGSQTFSWYLPHRWSAVGVVQVEQNEELDLDHRFVGGGGIERFLGRSNRMELSAAGGAVVTQERFSVEAGATEETSLEGLLAVGWSAFRFDSPKLDFSTTFALYPSFTQAGRVRGQGDLRLKYELFKDFNAGILFTDTFDSDPPEANRREERLHHHADDRVVLPAVIVEVAR
jgi:hypothetical protein